MPYRSTRGIGLAIVLAVVVAGCGHRSNAGPVSFKEWQSVISDWGSHGRFSASHSCAAVVVARSRVAPAYHEGMPLVHALDLYERKVCLTGNVWAVQEGMTDRQVASIAGAPVPWTSGPHCWNYHTSKPGTSIDARTFCFAANGKVSAIRTGYHL